MYVVVERCSLNVDKMNEKKKTETRIQNKKKRNGENQEEKEEKKNQQQHQVLRLVSTYEKKPSNETN